MNTVANKKNTYAWMAPKNTSKIYNRGGIATAVNAPIIESSKAPAKILPNRRKPNERILANSRMISRIPTAKLINPNIPPETNCFTGKNLEKYPGPIAQAPYTWVSITVMIARANGKFKSVAEPRKNGTTSQTVQTASCPSEVTSASVAASSAGCPLSIVYTSRLPTWSNFTRA